MRIYCATSNPGKLREFRWALSGEVDLRTVPGLRNIEPPEETGVTFEENAAQKALYYARFCDDGPVFVDDSGLAVDALNGEPGVYSARYAGESASDAHNNRLVLERMRGVADRAARFVCVIALARNGELTHTFRGEVEGLLLDEPRGPNGFGYDPLFYYPPLGCSFGEAPPEEKMKVSHRARALTAMLAFLRSGAST
jgi:XTP/dITP diphosphohydrolase